jgi:hypothetical protein
MNTRVWAGMLALIGIVTGCVSDEQKLTTVSSNPFSGPTRTQSAWMKQAPPATQKISLHVSEIGQKVMAANPQIGRKVAFLTIGDPKPEILHRVRGDNGEIYITEGLVNECKSDGELAAVLSQELGKMVSEEIAKTRPMRDQSSLPLLMSPRVGNDIGGNFGPADGSEQMILARYEKDRKQAQQAIVAPPPPEKLARFYLQNAGFNANDLAAVTPLLRKAEKNDNWEQLMTGKSAR